MELVILLLIILPLLSGIIINFLDKYKAPVYSTYIIFVTLIISLPLLFIGPLDTFSIGGIFEFNPDRLGLLLSSYILLVSFVIHKYSINYMREEEGYVRFFSLLDFMTTNLLILVLSDNMILLFTSWHLMGVILYFLLSHNYKRKEAVEYSNLSLTTHRLADVPLLIAILIIYKELNTLKVSEAVELILSDAGTEFNISLATFLIVLSAILKSAQIPFHLWLVYSMEGPTPVSAFMHAGIVNAGAFLVNRFAPLYVNDVFSLHLAFIVGSFTAILGSALMLVQNDVKKALGYSTVGQMGYMIMELGIGAFALAVYHMMAHGIFKATLFLYSGNVIHGARKDPNIPKDEFYKAITRGREISYKVPWFFYGILTVLVPLFIFILTHIIVEEEFFEYKTSLILLFFGWITGAQVLISTFRVGREKPVLTGLISILSLTVFLLGYVVIGHGLKVFLYPDAEFMEIIYHKSFGENPLFYLEMAFMALLILFGWLFMYYSSKKKYLPLHISLYAHLSNELYIPHLYRYIKNAILKISDRLLKLTFAPAVAGSFGIFILGIDLFYIPIILLASLFIPIFPVSLFTIAFIKRMGTFMLIVLPVIGILLIGMIEVPAVMKILASITFLIHSLRLFLLRSITSFPAELYSTFIPIIWLLDKKDLVLGLFLAMIPIVFFVISKLLERRFGTSDLNLLSGIMVSTPKLALTVVFILLFSVLTPPFVSFSALYVSMSYTLLSFILLSGWFVSGIALFTKLSKILFGNKRDDIEYRDLSTAEVVSLGGFIAVMFLSGVFYLAGGM